MGRDLHRKGHAKLVQLPRAKELTPLELPGSKVVDITDAPGVLASLRESGQRIVLCHGVFDLLHLGHIYHLQEAKRLGDFLVVTVTADRYVNKGPHRPAFTEAQRAEALAALECVDMVCVSHWPQAVEAIKLIRPDVYIKGQEYSDAAKDVTGGIGIEEQAVRSVGGRLVFTHGQTFSSTVLQNHFMNPFPAEAKSFLMEFSRRHPAEEMVEWLHKMGEFSALTVGEAIVDEYQYGNVLGKSSKEPILAFKPRRIDRYAGGILAVANHVAGLCKRTTLLTCLGGLNTHEDFIRQNLKPSVVPFLLRTSKNPTVLKRRYLQEYNQQKLFEVYEIGDEPFSPVEEEELSQGICRESARHDLVVCVDFGHGMMNAKAIESLCANAPFLALNCQANAGNMGYNSVFRYPRMDFYCMTEYEMRIEMRDNLSELEDIVPKASQRLNCPRIIVTRGKAGCLCFDQDSGFSSQPAVATRVVDRIGAGDTFLSVAALAVRAGAPLEVAGFLGNVAGAQAVANLGNSMSIDRVSLAKNIVSLLRY